MTSSPKNNSLLTLDNINPRVKAMQIAVRGPLVMRSLEIEEEITKGISKPFQSLIKANVGDAHALGQPPITFIREVLACVLEPRLLDTGEYRKDVIDHSRTILDACCGHSTGAYSQSPGIPVIRQHIAEYITERDGGIPADPETVFISDGASDSIWNVMKLFVNGEAVKKTGIMMPVPVFTSYEDVTEEYGMAAVGYYLDEGNNWALEIKELERALKESREKFDTRVLVVINPGNPTGQVLSEDNIKDIIRFAHEHDLFLLADEVYQDNIYAEGCKFHSFKKVMTNMGEPFCKHELASLHSASKGYMGECGMRAGYVELVNLSPDVYAMYKKLISVTLCANIAGQTVLDCVVNPPKAGEASYEDWLREKTTNLDLLKQRAELLRQAFGSIDGVECNPVQGAMYAFPRITIPPRAIEKAKKKGQKADFFYAMQLLETKGVCVMPGSGFGQREGTFHFRTTILPQPPVMKDMMERFKEFHGEFLKEYAGEGEGNQGYRAAMCSMI